MADIDILSFPVAPGLGGNEDVPIVQGGVNKRTTVQVLANLAIVPSAVTWKQQCAAATVEALPSNSYDNGFGGVGATLTATANGALEVDGYSPILDDRILVKNEATTANNGIYFVSQVGTGSLPWILTRAIDFDNIDNIQAGDACQITGGSTLASTFWIEVTVPTSIGSSPIVFAQLFLQYTAGNGIEINGASIAIDPAVVATLTGSQTLLNKTLSAPVITGLSANAILGTDGSGTVEAATTTGTGAVVLADSPTLVTPYLGVPSFIDLTNAVNLPPGSLPDGVIGLPIVGNGTGTPATFQQVPISAGVGGLGTGVSAFLATPSSANLATAVTDETGSGPLVFATSPTLVSPALGTPTSIVLTNGTGLPISSGVSGLGTGVATFLATPSSANLAAALTDETGTGSAVFANSPALTGTPTAPTASVGTNTTQIATTAFVLANGGGVNVADRATLAALSTSKAVAWLEEAGRQGMFQWNSANLSTQVTADTQQTVYVPPVSDPTGASGAWVRWAAGSINVMWGGVVADGVTDTTSAIEAVLAVCALLGRTAYFPSNPQPYFIANVTWVTGVNAYFDDCAFLVHDGATTSGFQMTGCSGWHFTGFFKMKSDNPGATGHIYGVNLGTPNDTTEQGSNFSIEAADFSDMARGIQICSASKFRLGHITGNNIYGTLQGGSDQVGSLVTIQASLDWDIALTKCTNNYKPLLYLGPSTFRDNQRGTVGRVEGQGMANSLASGFGVRSGIDVAVGEVVFDGGYRGIIIDHENSSGGTPDPYIIDRVSVGRAILSNQSTSAGSAIGVYVASVDPTNNPVGRLAFGEIIVTNADQYGVLIEDCTEFTFGTISVDGTNSNGNGLEGVKFQGNTHVVGGRIISRNSWSNGVRFTATNGANTGGIDQIDVYDANQSNTTTDAVRSDSGALSSQFKIGRINYFKTGTPAVADILDAGSDTPQTLIVGDVNGTGESSVVAVYNGAGGYQFRGGRLYKSAAPTAGTWSVGDTVWNTAPAAAGAPGWICTTAGSPGTWKAMANLAS